MYSLHSKGPVIRCVFSDIDEVHPLVLCTVNPSLLVLVFRLVLGFWWDWYIIHFIFKDSLV